jgi:hypothetical protein
MDQIDYRLASRDQGLELAQGIDLLHFMKLDPGRAADSYRIVPKKANLPFQRLCINVLIGIHQILLEHSGQ